MKNSFTLSFLVSNLALEQTENKTYHNKNSRKYRIKLTREQYEETRMVWKLSRYLNPRKYDGIDWQYQSSNEVLNNGITALQVLKTITNQNFISNYIPEQNDF